jgi:carboxymethylenebutenolidase
MGGLMSLTAAGTYPDEILATASYHGGRLATDAPDSPHLLAPHINRVSTSVAPPTMQVFPTT